MSSASWWGAARSPARSMHHMLHSANARRPGRGFRSNRCCGRGDEPAHLIMRVPRWFACRARQYARNCRFLEALPAFMRRKLSLPWRLAICVARTTLPLIGFSAAIVYQHYRQDQQDAFGRVLQVTRSIQQVLDREMQGIVSGLTVLAGSDSLARGEFRRLPWQGAGISGAFPGPRINHRWRSGG